ncbi:MAG TPA: choice-of-anchor G family protein [Cellulomonas sp.]
MPSTPRGAVRRRGGRAVAALTAGTMIAIGSAPVASAAPTDQSEAIAQLVDVDVLGLGLLDALGNTSGYPSDPDVDNGPADVAALSGLLNVTIGGVVLPLIGGPGQGLLDLGEASGAGIVNGFAHAPTPYQAAAASGAVTDDGTIDLSQVGDPSDTDLARVNLTSLLGQLGIAGLTNAVIDQFSLGLGALASSAQQTAGSAPTSDYVVGGAELTISSPLVAGLIGQINTAVAALDTQADALLSGTGAVQQALNGLALTDVTVALDPATFPGTTLTLAPGTPTVAGTVDLSAVTAGLFAQPLVSQNGLVSIDLTTGVITVDLAQLHGGNLNDLPANTSLLTSTEIGQITDTVTELLGEVTGVVTDAVAAALSTTAVTITLNPVATATGGATVTGAPTVVVTTTLGDLLAGTPGTVTAGGDLAVNGTVVPLTAIAAAVQPQVVGTVLPAAAGPVQAALATPVIADTIDGVVDGVVAGLDPLLGQVIAGLLSITVNQQPTLPVAGSTAPFTVRALAVQVLPGANAVSLGLARSTVRTLAALPVAPAVTGFTPTAGPTRGGTTVTLTGTGLDSVSEVDFGGLPGTGLVVAPGGGSLTVVTPASETAGGVPVTLVSPAGNVTAGTPFTYVAPTVTAVNPAQGPQAGGTAVTITGTGLTGATGATFGGAAATNVVVVNDTTITATVPAGTGVVDVAVQLPGADAGLTGAYAYLPPGAATISSVVPNSGPTTGGTTVTLTGTGYTGQLAVTFDGAPAQIISNPNATTLVVVTPPGARGPADIAVTNGTGATGVLPRAFTYLLDGSGATVTDIDPDQVSTAGGTVVTIVGDGFTGATDVLFDGVPGTGLVVSQDGTTLTVTAPASEDAGTAQVSIVFPDGTIAAGPVTYVAPTVTALTPPTGPTAGGTTVTLTGTGLGGTQQVLFGGVPGTGLMVSPDGTSLTVVTPAGTFGAADVQVVLPGMDVLLADAFTYLAPGTGAPTIDAVDPATGSTSGGTRVVIRGTSFVPGATTVALCGVVVGADEVMVNAAGTRLVFRTPACAAGVQALTVTTPLGSVTTAFRYVDGRLATTGPGAAGGLLALSLLLLGGGAALTGGRRSLAVLRAAGGHGR